MRLRLIQRYREAPSGSRISFFSGAITLALTFTIFFSIFRIGDRMAWVETGNAVGGIMSVIAVTFGAIALWSTIDSNSVLSERSDRVFESKQALEEALALYLKTAEICERYRGSESELLVTNARKAVREVGWEAMKSGLYRLLLTRDNSDLKDGVREHIDTMASLQFLTLLNMVEGDAKTPQINAGIVELALKLSGSLGEITYAQIRRSLRQKITEKPLSPSTGLSTTKSSSN